MLLQQRNHLALPWMAEMTSDHGELGEGEQHLIERHRLLRHRRSQWSWHTDIDLDWDAEFDALRVNRKVTRMIGRQADERRHDPAGAEAEFLDRALEPSHRAHHAGRIDAEASVKARGMMLM